MNEWFLIVLIIVQSHGGTISERQLYSPKQTSENACEIEAASQAKLFYSQLGKTSALTRYSLSGTTYTIPLNGKLIGYTLGCELRKKGSDHKNISHFSHVN